MKYKLTELDFDRFLHDNNLDIMKITDNEFMLTSDLGCIDQGDAKLKNNIWYIDLDDDYLENICRCSSVDRASDL